MVRKLQIYQQRMCESAHGTMPFYPPDFLFKTALMLRSAFKILSASSTPTVVWSTTGAALILKKRNNTIEACYPPKQVNLLSSLRGCSAS